MTFEKKELIFFVFLCLMIINMTCQA